MHTRYKPLYVTVCKNTVLRNIKQGKNDPPLRVSSGKYGKPQYAHSVDLSGAKTCIVVYAPNTPLPWGARAWIEARYTPKRVRND